jgi:hypothetical protein
MDSQDSARYPSAGPVSHTQYTQQLHTYGSKHFSRRSNYHRLKSVFSQLSPTAEDALCALHRSTALCSLANLPTAQVPLDCYISPTALLTKHRRFTGFHVKTLSNDTRTTPEPSGSPKTQLPTCASIVSPPRIPSAVRSPCPYGEPPVFVRIKRPMATQRCPPGNLAAESSPKTGFWETCRSREYERSMAKLGTASVEATR